MGSPREKYVRLAPLDVDSETKIACLAQHFFSPMCYREVCQVIGKASAENAISPMASADFLKYLDAMEVLREPADKYIYHIRDLLGRMAASNILVEVGSSGTHVLIPKSYYTSFEASNIRSTGLLWLAKPLGGRFIHRQVSPAIVHIAGEDEPGNVVAGSGVIFDSHHILTCRHVVSGMRVDRKQKFQGKEVTIEERSIFKHEKDDVAVIRVDTPLNPIPGLAFLSPMVTQAVYTFGYPKIPNVRPRLPDTDDAYLVVQRGEVTNEHVVASDKTELFLYSAIARPGNSGGAIVSDDGYVVGIATDLTDGQYEGENIFSPHFAGIPAHIVAKAVTEMELDVQIPYETFA